MAKLKVPATSSAPVAPATNGEAPATNGETPAAPEATKPVATREERAALFAAASACDDEIKTHEDAIDLIKDRKAEAVKAIKEACGNGPFGYKGEILEIGHREGKHFFKVRGSLNVTDV